MTITISYATADGGVYCYSTAYADAISGAGTRVLTADAVVTIGQGANVVDPFVVDEAFFQWSYAVPAGHACLAAHLAFTGYTVSSPGVARDMIIISNDWGASLTTGDYLSLVPAYTQLTRVNSMEGATSGVVARAGLPWATLTGSGTLRTAAFTNTAYYNYQPSVDERVQLHASEATGTTLDPRLVYLTAPTSPALGLLGTSTQLSDGTHVYVSRVDSAAAPYVELIHHDGATRTVLDNTYGESPLSAAASPTTTVGMQILAVTRDAADNVYLLSGDVDTIRVRTYTKNTGYAWTRGGGLSAALPGYAQSVGIANQTVAAWLPAGGTAGTIVALMGHMAGIGATNQTVVAMLNCDTLLAGTGTVLRGSGCADSWVFTAPASSDLVSFHNETGTGMDLVAAPGTTTTLFGLTYNRADQVSHSAISLNVGEATLSETQGTETIGITKDPSSKARVLPVSATTAVFLFADRIRVRDASLNLLGSAALSTEGMTSFPTAATMATTATWDAVYYPPDHKVWVYYLDVADGHRLMRTGFSLDTMLATREEIEVATGVGTGGTNQGVRVPRGAITGHTVRVAIMGSLSATVYVDDSLNAPPTQPTLTTHPNYDAADAAVFAWAFNDPSPLDTQSAYQLQIDDVAAGAVVDTTKTTSATESATVAGGTLTNGHDYRWRIRTWDVLDAEGPWSEYGVVSTSATGSVTITAPATSGTTIDYSTYTLGWSVTGATQDQYRVRVVDTGTSVVLSDTGWLTGVATTYGISGLLSDGIYRIEVTVRDAGVDSNTATTLLCPTYGHPEVPSLAVTATTSGYTLVSVTNPAPTGDTLQADHNDILRRASSSDTWGVIGQAQAGSEYRDHTAGSGTSYEYMARAYAGPTSDSAYTDSEVDTCAITLDGVWIHDPVDPDGTARNFPYGRDTRSNAITVEQAGQHYAGRTYPVFDYGDPRDDTLTLKIDVPSGPDHRADLAALAGFAAARAVVVVRDNRGRIVTGSPSGYTVSDESWGARVSLTVTTADTGAI